MAFGGITFTSNGLLLLSGLLLLCCAQGDNPTYSECRPHIDATIRDLAAKALKAGEEITEPSPVAYESITPAASPLSQPEPKPPEPAVGAVAGQVPLVGVPDSPLPPKPQDIRQPELPLQHVPAAPQHAQVPQAPPAAGYATPTPSSLKAEVPAKQVLGPFNRFISFIFGLPPTPTERDPKWSQPWQTHAEHIKKKVEEPEKMETKPGIISTLINKCVTLIFGLPKEELKREAKWAEPWHTHIEHVKKEKQKLETPVAPKMAEPWKIFTYSNKFIGLIFGKSGGPRDPKWSSPWQTHEEHKKKEVSPVEEKREEKRAVITPSQPGIFDKVIKLIFNIPEVERDPKWSKPWQTHEEHMKVKVEKTVEEPVRVEYKAGVIGDMFNKAVGIIFGLPKQPSQRDPKWSKPWQTHAEHKKVTEAPQPVVKAKPWVTYEWLNKIVNIIFSTSEVPRDPKWAQPWQTHKKPERAFEPTPPQPQKALPTPPVSEPAPEKVPAYTPEPKIVPVKAPEEELVVPVQRPGTIPQPSGIPEKAFPGVPASDISTKKKEVEPEEITAPKEKTKKTKRPEEKVVPSKLDEAEKMPEVAPPTEQKTKPIERPKERKAKTPKDTVTEEKVTVPKKTKEDKIDIKKDMKKKPLKETDRAASKRGEKPAEKAKKKITRRESEEERFPKKKTEAKRTKKESLEKSVVYHRSDVGRMEEARREDKRTGPLDEAHEAIQTPPYPSPIPDSAKTPFREVLEEAAKAPPPSPAPQEEEEPIIMPSSFRSREHIDSILGLDLGSRVATSRLQPIAESTLRELKKVYENSIKPLEGLYMYQDISNRHVSDAELFSGAVILLLGPYSTGKSTFINYLCGTEFTRRALKTGTPPSHGVFRIIQYGDFDRDLGGTDIIGQWSFSSLQKFGQNFVDQLKGKSLNVPVLKKVTLVEAPGILEMRRPGERLYPFNDVVQWFIDRADLILVMFDYTKLDAGLELEAILDQLKGRESQTRILLNKADQVPPEELIKVQGSLFWNLSPLLGVNSPPTVYAGSFASFPYRPGSPMKLFQAQEEALLHDIAQAINLRVDNRIALGRRHAVRVRNHAQMVDTYLNTYYKNKGFLTSKHKLSEDIIENPHAYNIYEGMSLLTNISRYDLPDAEVYRDFFRVHSLYDFKTLRETCTFLGGCPLDKIETAINSQLPQLLGKYRRLVEAAVPQTNFPGPPTPASGLGVAHARTSKNT